MPYVFESAMEEDDRVAELDLAQWPALYALAEENGWTPKGTSDPMLTNEDEEDEEPGYFQLLGQLISPEDAQALASALRKALPDPLLDGVEVDLGMYSAPAEEVRDEVLPFLELCEAGNGLRIV